MVREAVDPLETDRRMDGDIESVREVLQDGRLLADVASELDDAGPVGPGA